MNTIRPNSPSTPLKPTTNLNQAKDAIKTFEKMGRLPELVGLLTTETTGDDGLFNLADKETRETFRSVFDTKQELMFLADHLRAKGNKLLEQDDPVQAQNTLELLKLTEVAAYKAPDVPEAE
jgi:hypothetical protein